MYGPPTFCWAAFVVLACASSALGEERPNILWLTSEDNGPHVGAQGDFYATAPNLDRLPERGADSSLVQRVA